MTVETTREDSSTRELPSTREALSPPSPLQDVEAWLRWRRGGIGSSDSPAIMGVCPRRTRMAVYLDKIGEAGRRPESSEACSWGKRLEPLIAAAYAEKTGILVERREAPACHPDSPWFRATIDGVGEDGRIIEFKSVGCWSGFSAPAGDWRALPEPWIVQVQHQMIAAGQDWCDVAVFVPLELRLYSVPRIPSLCGLIYDAAADLWSCVVDRVPPATNDPRDAEIIARCYPRAEGEIDLPDPALIAHADALRTDRKSKAAKVALLDAMQGAASATLADGRIVRRKVTQRAAYTVPASVIETIEIVEARNPNEAGARDHERRRQHV